MELQVLRSFQAVAEGTTVTEAAAEARITQPALSRALNRLEEEVGAELFQRVGRVLQLTPAGRVFKEHADAVLDSYDRGLRAVAEVVDPDDLDRRVDYGERGRVLLTTLTREFFMPRFPERDEGGRAEPCAAYPWDGVRDLGLLTALQESVAVGVY